MGFAREHPENKTEVVNFRCTKAEKKSIDDGVALVKKTRDIADFSIGDVIREGLDLWFAKNLPVRSAKKTPGTATRGKAAP